MPEYGVPPMHGVRPNVHTTTGVPLFCFCPADHRPDRQPLSILLGIVKGRRFMWRHTHVQYRFENFGQYFII